MPDKPIIFDIQFEVSEEIRKVLHATYLRLSPLKPDFSFEDFILGIAFATVSQSVSVIAELANSDDDDASIYSGVIEHEDREVLQAIIERLRCDPDAIISGVDIDPELVVACATSVGLHCINENETLFDGLLQWLKDDNDDE